MELGSPDLGILPVLRVAMAVYGLMVYVGATDPLPPPWTVGLVASGPMRAIWWRGARGKKLAVTEEGRYRRLCVPPPVLTHGRVGQ